MRDSHLFLTEKGRKICDFAGDLWNEAQKQFEDIVGKERVTQLEKTLEILQTL